MHFHERRKTGRLFGQREFQAAARGIVSSMWG